MQTQKCWNQPNDAIFNGRQGGDDFSNKLIVPFFAAFFLSSGQNQFFFSLYMLPNIGWWLAANGRAEKLGT